MSYVSVSPARFLGLCCSAPYSVLEINTNSSFTLRCSSRYAILSVCIISATHHLPLRSSESESEAKIASFSTQTGVSRHYEEYDDDDDDGEENTPSRLHRHLAHSGRRQCECLRLWNDVAVWACQLRSIIPSYLLWRRHVRFIIRAYHGTFLGSVSNGYFGLIDWISLRKLTTGPKLNTS